MKETAIHIDPAGAILSRATQPDIDLELLAGMCKALGHPARIRILRHLLAEDRCICGRIVEIMPLAQSTVSQHLKILKESGLVQGEVEGPKTCYCLNKDRLNRLLEMMTDLFNQENKK